MAPKKFTSSPTAVRHLTEYRSSSMDDDITLGAYMEGIPLPSGASHYGFCESAAAVYPCTQQLIARLATLLGPGKAGMLKLSLKMDGDDVVATVNCVHEVLKQLQRVQEDNSVLADEISRLQSNNRAKDTRIERTNDAHDKQLRELTFSLQGAKALENELRGTISSSSRSSALSQHPTMILLGAINSLSMLSGRLSVKMRH